MINVVCCSCFTSNTQEHETFWFAVDFASPPSIDRVLACGLSLVEVLVMKTHRLLLAFLLTIASSAVLGQENRYAEAAEALRMPKERFKVEVLRNSFIAANNRGYFVTEAAVGTTLYWPHLVEIRALVSDGFISGKGAVRMWGVFAGPSYSLRINSPPLFGEGHSGWAVCYPFLNISFGGGYRHMEQEAETMRQGCIYLNLQTGWRLTQHLDLILLSVSTIADFRKDVVRPMGTLSAGIGLKYRF